MGNCVRKDSGKQRAGDYWDSPAEKSLLSGREIGKRDEDSGKRPMKEVKIKITKKQLEELLGMKEMQGLTLEQVLTRLINGGDGVFQSNQRSWRPALQSIPE
ncbi:hypothetical protein L1987_08078 [Smallanthus sonchifolius]|uniref:Uncharacterized protein n=1 Tax=Smallanthus sonchifolius TaxID=185202 RepID=A0ACB9JJQ5_9ASTR|nr:hypothetical protein L1987_08078 [Smallanthus sonchifolius]